MERDHPDLAEWLAGDVARSDVDIDSNENRTIGCRSGMGVVSKDVTVRAVGIAPTRSTPDSRPRVVANEWRSASCSATIRCARFST
ncbi:MAG: hypothetical protein PHQ28_12515 [Mycobacterium sp.]|nr:hypothetical protein [Mycobacterium sp.]